MTTKPKETDLYLPVKALLMGQGYEVKGEILSADIVAIREGQEPVVVELKTGFTLKLIHQAIERLDLTDHVYVAVPRISGRTFLKTLNQHKRLCRRLGIGLITVRLRDGYTEIHLDPGPYQPRKSKPKKTRLLREFEKRVGDPNLGGASSIKPGMTAYRQDALRCLSHLKTHGPTKASLLAKETNVPSARNIMAADHYGWFERVERGIYDLTPKGVQACQEYQHAIKELNNAKPEDTS